MNQVLRELFPLFVKLFNQQIVLRIPEKLRPIVGITMTAILYFCCEMHYLSDYYGGLLIGLVGGAFLLNANMALVGAGFGLAIAQAVSSKKAEPGSTSFTPVVAAPVAPGNAMLIVEKFQQPANIPAVNAEPVQTKMGGIVAVAATPPKPEGKITPLGPEIIIQTKKE